MKKIFTLTLSLFIVAFAFGQNEKFADNVFNKSKTLNVPKSTLLSEDFSTWLPTGWTIESGAGSTASGNELWHGVGGSAEIQSNASSVCDEWLYTPQISLPDAAVRLRWDWYGSFFWMADPNDDADLMVKISTDGGSTWSDAIWVEDDETMVTNSGVNWPWTDWTWHTSEIDISSYAGQDINIAWHYEGGNGAQFKIDNILLYDIVDLDLELTYIDVPMYIVPGNFYLGGTITNYGASNITSFDITYNVDDGTESEVFTITGIDVGYLETYGFVDDIPYLFDTEGTYDINVTISNVNGGGETYLDNNVLSSEVIVSSEETQRTVLVEQFTTEQCPNCPPVLSYLEEIIENNDNVILMSHHTGYYTDFLTIDESVDHLEFYNAGGSTFAPAGMFDRHHNGLDNDGSSGVDPGPVFWDGNPFGGNRIDDRASLSSYVTVNIYGENNSGELTLTVTGQFLEDFTHDLGVSLWITEDNIEAQSQAGATGGWTHRYSVRDVISERLGDPIITSTNQGDSYFVQYTYTINGSWNEDELYLVAMVNDINGSDVNDREIHNAKQVKLSQLHAPFNQSVTMEIDMTPAIEAGIFTPTTDVLYLTGSMTEWADPGSAESIEMTEGTDNVYYTNLSLASGDYQYKYFRGPSWDLGEWDGDPNREFTVAGSSETVHVAWADLLVNVENFDADVSIYPNPTSGIIEVVANGNYIVDVIDVTGKTVRSSEMNNRTTIDISNENAGLYLVRLRNDKGFATYQILKK